MLNINILKFADYVLKKLPIKHKKQIIQKIITLATNPIPNDSKVIKGFIEYRRADIGEYRIIYKFSNITLFVVLIGKRNDDEVYRKFKRLM